MSIRNTVRAAALACAFAGIAPLVAMAGDSDKPRPHGFWLTTPAPELTAPAGKPISLPITIINDTEEPKRATLTLSGVPEDWKWSLKRGGYAVGAAMIGPGEIGSLTLELEPPTDLKPSEFALDLKASYKDAVVELPLKISIVDAITEKPTLVPDTPELTGGVKTEYQFALQLTNAGADDALFTLRAEAPNGFWATFRRGYSYDEISGIPVAAGGSETVTAAFRLDPSVAAGDYPLKVTAVANGEAATADLGIHVTGSPALKLGEPQDRLSGTAEAGEASALFLTLKNNGGGPARGVKLEAIAPVGWKVAFSPAGFDELAPGEKATVSIAVTPTEKAIAGDYMVSVRAEGEGTSDIRELRITVMTSAVWGVVGLAAIASALLVMALAVLRYGRR